MKLNILLKECQLSQNQEQGICVYYSPKHVSQFVTTLTVPVTIKPKLSIISSYIYLPKGNGNNLKIIIVGFLEVGFDRTHAHILDKIKEFLYDKKTTLADTGKSQLQEKTKINWKDEHLKRVLMQFFNIVASHSYPTAHVYYFLQVYPFVLFLLEALFKKILESLGVKITQASKQDITTAFTLQTLCKFFDCLFQKAQDNVYWIARKVVFFQDKNSIYKNKFDQEGAQKMIVNYDLDQVEQTISSTSFRLEKYDSNKANSQKSSDTNSIAWQRSQSGSRLTMQHQFGTKPQTSEEKRNNMFLKKQYPSANKQL